MRNHTPWIIACSLLLYRWLLTLAPDEFADKYADPALQVFRQCCWDAYHAHGTRDVLRLWLPTFADAFHGILAEQRPVAPISRTDRLHRASFLSLPISI